MNGRVVQIVLACLLLWAGLRWFERLNLYIPSGETVEHPGTYGIPFEDVELTTSDGVRLHAWFSDASKADTKPNALNEPPLPPTKRLETKGSPPVLVVFHGNGGNISHRVQKLRIFRGMGLSVFMFDYRGYGKSEGRPSEQGTYLDGLAAVDWLKKEKGLAPRELLYYGESLGCAVALETALERPPKALILDSAFTSTVAMGQIVFPFLPVSWMVRYRYDNEAKIGRLKSPLLIMHSPQDDIVPYRMGEKLFAEA
ncbi:MAG: alpha/beta hydrolase, partial [Elusimicrobiota bacterium]